MRDVTHYGHAGLASARLPCERVIPTSENYRKHTMGSVANKIAKKITTSGKSKVVKLASWREGRKMVLEARVTDDAINRFQGYDPCHAVYIFAQNVSSCMAESISVMREAKGYYRIVGDAEDEYLPGGPPLSPLTGSYFTMWAMFDVQFGSSRETMGSCILRIFPEFDCPSWLMETVEQMQQSRMGFYVHCGHEGEGVLLREVGTREIISCTVPTGYTGFKGQIWFVRVLPPTNRLCRRHIVINTPYVIRDYPERAFVAYLERELGRMMRMKPPRTDNAHGHLMKFGPDPNHWNEYILCAYSGHQYDAIFLTGIPDIPQSLPHA